jgi:hypothetical protein
LVGVAVNVTDVPAHTFVLDALMETDGVTGEVTVYVATELDAVVELRQDALLVIIQLTVFPVASVLLE